jgi:hypothetical protein
MIAVLMMHPMHRHPENRATFKRQRRADGEKVFNPFWSLKAAMGQQPVVAHTNPKIDGEYPKNDRDCQSAPTEIKQRSYSANMESPDKTGRNPIDSTVVCFASHSHFRRYRNARGNLRRFRRAMKALFRS